MLRLFIVLYALLNSKTRKRDDYIANVKLGDV